MEEEKVMNPSMLDMFNVGQENFEEAQSKFNKENSKRTEYLRFSKDGDYTVRILPLAPVEVDGKYTLPRKGYEYPTKELVLKIDVNDPKAKAPITYVSVVNAKLAFPNLPDDLIDLYTALVSKECASDPEMVKKVTGNSFSGGLRFDTKRCMYVYDMGEENKGPQILQLSYKQYKELEERKLAIWAKLRKNDVNAGCPVCSPKGAYVVEVKRSNNNGKTEYSLNIDTLSERRPLTEAQMKELFNLPRLPEVIYHYTRRQLEATIVFLNQYDEKHGLNIMGRPEIAKCIEQIKLTLPADDTSHFNMGGASEGSSATPGAPDGKAKTVDDLWDMHDEIEDKKLDAHSDEARELRTQIQEYIEAHNLDIVVRRNRTNYELIKEIADKEAASDGFKEVEPASAPAPATEPEQVPDAAPAPEDVPEDVPAPVERRRADRPQRRRS